MRIKSTMRSVGASVTSVVTHPQVPAIILPPCAILEGERENTAVIYYIYIYIKKLQKE